MNQKEDPNQADENPRIDQQVMSLLLATRAWFANSFDMIMLDGQLAGLSLIRMLIFGLVAAVLLITTWMLLLFSLGYFLSSLGWSITVILLTLAGLTLVCALILIARIAALSTNLGFKATRQQLSGSNTKTTEAEVERPADQNNEVDTYRQNSAAG